MSRCTGACCKDIGLAVSPEMLRASYMTFIESQGRGHLEREQISAHNTRGRLGGGRTSIYEDIHLIYPMLTFTHQDRTHPDGGEPGKSSSTVYHYKCKHFDGANCTVYDIRPRMCSSFGTEDRGCGYGGCQWKEAAGKFEAFKKAREQRAESEGACEKMAGC